MRYVRNPDTGKRISRLNPKAEWITKDILSLRFTREMNRLRMEHRASLPRQGHRARHSIP